MINHKKRIINVDNETKFLNDYAAKKRNSSKAKILAITGSAGKTSLKNLIYELLKNYGSALCSPKSYNNQQKITHTAYQTHTTIITKLYQHHTNIIRISYKTSFHDNITLIQNKYKIGSK